MWLQVDLDRNAGILITLNPGRPWQTLAEAAQQPETPVSPVSRPDNELVAELKVLLFAEGFKQAKTLGRKPVAAFLCHKLGFG